MKVILMLLVAFPLIVIGKVELNQSGKWSDATIWDKGQVPDLSDTVVIGAGYDVQIDRDSVECQVLFLEGRLHFNTVGKYFHCHTISIKGDASLNSDYLGKISADTINVVGKVAVEGVHLSIDHQMKIMGEVRFIRQSGDVLINELNINSGGIWAVENDRSFVLRGSCVNHGTFISGKGRYTFHSKSNLSGDSLWHFDKINIIDTLINSGICQIDESIEGSMSLFRNESYSVLELKCLDSKIECSFELKAKENQLKFSRTGNQKLPALTDDTFYKIQINNTGNFEIPSSVIGIDSLIVSSTSKVDLTHVKSGGNLSLIVIEDAHVQLNVNTADADQNPLLNSYRSVQFSEGSKLSVESDGVLEVVTNNVFNHLSFSTLGFLQVQVKSNELKVNDLFIGSGVLLDVEDHTLSIEGDCSGGGELLASSGTVIYTGTQSQNFFGTHYGHLKLNHNSSDTNVFYGTYKVDTLSIVKGKLRVGSLNVGLLRVENSGELHVGGSTPSFTFQVENNGRFYILSDAAEITFKGGLSTPPQSLYDQDYL